MEEMMKQVMREDVTLEEWKKFHDYYKALPTIMEIEKRRGGKATNEEVEASKKRRQQFYDAARYVASVLTEKEIFQDSALTLVLLSIKP